MKHVIIIGGGIAGMQCAIELSQSGIAVTLIEKERATGGKLRGWHKLFPSFTPAEQVLGELRGRMLMQDNITVKTGAEATAIAPQRVTL